MKEVPKRPSPGVAGTTVMRHLEGDWARHTDQLAEEVPVAFIYNGIPYAVMLASPCDLEDFACGFSRTEGLISTPAEIRALDIRHVLAGIELRIELANDVASVNKTGGRALPGPSSCGLCGTRDLEDAIRWPLPVANDVRISSHAIHPGLAGMRAQQTLHEATGATHAAAWLATDGALQLLREDIGRHNALDKLIGAMLEQGRTPREGFLAVSSRASYELVQKAASIGIELMVAVSAPTALAVKMADGANMTLIAFAREHQHIAYTHPERMVDYVTSTPRTAAAGVLA